MGPPGELMSITRHEVLEELAAASDASRGELTTVAALTASVDADRSQVLEHVNALVACELACLGPADGVRITVTGEELLELDTDNGAIIAPTTSTPNR